MELIESWLLHDFFTNWQRMIFLHRWAMTRPYLELDNQKKAWRWYQQQALRSKFLVTAKGWYLQAFYLILLKFLLTYVVDLYLMILVVNHYIVLVYCCTVVLCCVLLYCTCWVCHASCMCNVLSLSNPNFQNLYM